MRRARGAGRRGLPRLGVPKRVRPLRGDFYKGAGPLVRVGEAGFWAEPTRKRGILEQDVDRPSGEPSRVDAVKHAARLVVAANPRLQ